MDPFTTPTAIANDGTIVGSYGSDFQSRGFILRNGEYTTVAYPGAEWTTLTGMAPDGTIVGAVAHSREDDPEAHGPWRGFAYRGGRSTFSGTGCSRKASTPRAPSSVRSTTAGRFARSRRSCAADAGATVDLLLGASIISSAIAGALQ